VSGRGGVISSSSGDRDSDQLPETEGHSGSREPEKELPSARPPDWPPGEQRDRRADPEERKPTDGASDAYTRELKVIEDELGALNLGVEAESGPLATSVVMDDDPADPTSAVRVDRLTFLAYGRDSHGWALFVRRYRLVPPDSLNGGAPIVSALQTALGVKVKALEGTQRLLSASREVRLTAADHISTLLDNLAEAARTNLQAVKKVASSASNEPTLSRLGTRSGTTTDVSGSSPIPPGTPVTR